MATLTITEADDPDLGLVRPEFYDEGVPGLDSSFARDGVGDRELIPPAETSLRDDRLRHAFTL